MTLAETARMIARDMDAAHAEWGCNCGPSSLAAITYRTLAEVRPHLGDFERKGYTNPTLMIAALESLDVSFTCRTGRAQDWPLLGLARIQWHGPWMDPGVPIGARYRKTHWVAAMHAGGIGVFDCNALANGVGWVSQENWEKTIVPFILESYPTATGEWSITHSIEIHR